RRPYRSRRREMSSGYSTFSRTSAISSTSTVSRRKFSTAGVMTRTRRLTRRLSFRNPFFNGKRGVIGDTAYKEYIAPADRAAVIALAGSMRDAIAAVRGHSYGVEQSLDLYPTAGTSDDYAFSRHSVDPASAKVYAFTVEWGATRTLRPFIRPMRR